MSYFKRAIKEIDRGRQGLNVGIPISFEKIKKYLPNIQQKTYYLLGANQKVGKTSLGDDLFFYGPIDYVLDNPDCDIELDIDYFSFEIDIKSKIIKGISRKLWHDYGLVVDMNRILSRADYKLDDEIYELILKYEDYYENLERFVTIHETKNNPYGIYKYLVDKASQNGTIYKKNIQKDPSKKPMMRFDYYKPNNPNKYWIIIIDHIALSLQEKGKSVKQTIDDLSQYLVEVRNNFEAIPVVIQQFSADNESEDRFKSKRLTPTIKDFGDSKYTTRDANVIISLFSPNRVDIPFFNNYNIKVLGNTFRNLEILENRDGPPNINVGLNYIGPCGTFREMPHPDKITSKIYDSAVSYKNDKSKYVKINDNWVLRESLK